MARLSDHKSEIRALKTLVGNNQNLQAMIFARISAESFSFPPAQELFTIIKQHAASASGIPSWEVLLSDRNLSEGYAQALQSVEAKECVGRADVDYTLNRLEKFRANRTIYELAEALYNGVKSDTEVDHLISMAADRLASARSSRNTDEFIMHANTRGKNSRTLLSLIKDIQKGETLHVIPTGFHSFDRENGGLPRGSCFTIGAPSGEGKSAMALQIAVNMALFGAKICLVSLEMSLAQVWVRALSSLSAIPVNDISMRRLSPGKWKELERVALLMQSSLAMSGGQLSIHTPNVDPDIEELLYGLKPYGYDVIFIDYMSLLKGFSGDQFWLKIGEGMRLSKRFAETNEMSVAPVVQTDDDGKARFSQMIKDNASLMWVWGAVKDGDSDSKKKSKNSIESFDVKMPKSRNQTPIDMKCYRRFDIMQLTDNVNALGRPWIEKIPYYDELSRLSNKKLEKLVRISSPSAYKLLTTKYNFQKVERRYPKPGATRPVLNLTRKIKAYINRGFEPSKYKSSGFKEISRSASKTGFGATQAGQKPKAYKVRG